MGFGVFEKFVDASPLQTEVRVIGQQGVEGQFEEAVQGTASGIDGGYSGRGKHYMLFLRIRADIFQEGRFARTCFARQEYGLTGIPVSYTHLSGRICKGFMGKSELLG